MSASVTIYCLQECTDYFGFERLCHDLMAHQGYSGIEPLGSFNDKGRDAIHVDRSGQTTIFAYSVREGWYAKLLEDANKIRKHNHDCDRLVFISTSNTSASERDLAQEHIRTEFGWDLELYSLERLRVLLDSEHPHLKSEHPQIFPPALVSASEATAPSSQRIHLLISHSDADTVFATWLAEKLTVQGYAVWARQFSRLGGEAFPENLDSAIQNKAARVISVYSTNAIADPEVVRVRSLTKLIGDELGVNMLIPVLVEEIKHDDLDKASRSLDFIDFSDSWAHGLRAVLGKLEGENIPQPIVGGSHIAASTFLDQDVLVDQPEWLYTNCLRIEKVPLIVHRITAKNGLPWRQARELEFQWPHRRIDRHRYLSFQTPPREIMVDHDFGFDGGVAWRETDEIDGVNVDNLVSELIRKSVNSHCIARGLEHTADRGMIYFPSGLVNSNRLRFTRPDGSSSWVKAAGSRKFWSPERSEVYSYHLAPDFYVSQRLFERFVLKLRVRIFFTNEEDEPLDARKISSRRKHLCRDWWNHEWLSRIFAICAFLSKDGKITVGQGQEETLEIHGSPVRTRVPVGINEERVDLLRSRNGIQWVEGSTPSKE